MVHEGEILYKYLTDKGIEKEEFARKIDMTRANLYNVFKRNEIGGEKWEKIVKALNVTRQTLLENYDSHRQGNNRQGGNQQPDNAPPVSNEMETRDLKDEIEAVDHDAVQYLRVPVVDLDATASPVVSVDGEGYKINEVISEREKVERQPHIKYSALTLIFRIKGDSMQPNYREGEKILCTWVDDGNWKFLTGVCVLSLKSGMLLLKRVAGLGDGRLRLKSDNDDYPELTVDTGDLQAVWQMQYFTLAHKR